MSPSDAAADASHRAGGSLDWIILDTQVLTDDDTQNATTATALTRWGEPIRVTLVAAQPPRVSYFCVQCSCMKQDEYKHHEGHAPNVIYSEGGVALLRASADEYYIYKAGRRPSLRLLPAACCDAEDFLRESVGFVRAGFVPVGDDGEHFVMAAVSLSYSKWVHELHVFRSEHGTWTKTPLDIEIEGSLDVAKVTSLGGGKLGWITLLQGILVCDVLGENPEPRLIPLPDVLPCNQSLEKRHCHLPRSFRDVVVFADGSIKCVEMEHVYKREHPDVSDADVLYDADLVRKPSWDAPRREYQYLGWRIITWNRAASSDCWRKGALFHVNDIRADDALLRQIIVGDDGDRNLTVAHLTAEVPTLSLDGGDVVYIACKANPCDTETWVVSLDTGKKTLEEAALVISGQEESTGFISNRYGTRKPFKSSYTSCALSKYLTLD